MRHEDVDSSTVRRGVGSGARTAVVVSMKPRLRGRIRRNVETLLLMGFTVVFLTHADPGPVRGDLSHPHFQVMQIPVRSWLERAQIAVSAMSRRRLERLRTQARRRSRRRVQTWIRSDFDQPRLGEPPRSLWFRIRRWRRRMHRLALRTYRRTMRRAQRERNAIWRWMIRTVRWALRPFHRFSRFLAFWEASAAETIRRNPDLVVSSDLPGLVGASRAARKLNRPHAHDCHELYLESTALSRLDKFLFHPFERMYMRRADVVFAVNHSIAAEYRRRYGLKRMRVVRNCAQLPGHIEPVELWRVAHLPRQSTILLYQGGFAPGRGLEVLIDGVSELPENVALVMLGFGAMEEELWQLAAKRGIGDRFRIVPAVPPEQLLSYTAGAAVGIIPYQPVSRNNYFSLPNKVFEYTAVGVPIIASDLPELRKVAVSSRCGVVYDPYDPASFTAAAANLLQAPVYLQARDAALQYGAENHWGLERRRFETAINRLLPGGVEAPRPVDPLATLGERPLEALP